MTDGNINYEERERAFVVYVEKMDKVKEIIKQIDVVHKQHEELVRQLNQFIADSKQRHPLYIAARKPEMDEKLLQAGYKLKLSEWMCNEAERMAEQAYDEWQSKLNS